ncbi:hypothetical protein ACFFLZ_05170 [Photobacterium aphoticum]|nr:hypothetical protein [Photobacterium aphoticum]GHA32564.1 hypothetical protein GCM10007086_02160 [Photobacterium aphoticum]
MLFKIPLLLMLLYYHAQSQQSIRAGLFWFGGMLFITAITTSLDSYSFVHLLLSTFIALLYFHLLEKMENLFLWWITMLLGAAALMVF